MPHYGKSLDHPVFPRKTEENAVEKKILKSAVLQCFAVLKTRFATNTWRATGQKNAISRSRESQINETTEDDERLFRADQQRFSSVPKPR